MKRKSLPTGRDFLFVEGYGNENPGAFQSPRPLRGATELCFSGGNFNPRAPCGARPVTKINVVTEITFQPTRPLRGATGDSVIFCAGSPDFNPRAPCGARPGDGGRGTGDGDFNPRAPCGARLPFLVVSKGKQAFQPTRPLRGATIHSMVTFSHGNISTHAPLAGRDPIRVIIAIQRENFNPRAPCGARPRKYRGLLREPIYFNPRAPCGARQSAGPSK